MQLLHPHRTHGRALESSKSAFIVVINVLRQLITSLGMPTKLRYSKPDTRDKKEAVAANPAKASYSLQSDVIQALERTPASQDPSCFLLTRMLASVNSYEQRSRGLLDPAHPVGCSFVYLAQGHVSKALVARGTQLACFRLKPGAAAVPKCSLSSQTGGWLCICARRCTRGRLGRIQHASWGDEFLLATAASL